MPSFSFTIIGDPRTKNTGKLARTATGKQFVLPPRPWVKWFKGAKAQLPFARVAAVKVGIQLPITTPVTVTAIWWRSRNVGDEDRYKVALGDYLQKVGIVRNDSQIHWGNCRRDKDPSRPRTDITIEL